jgi:hypothetical protein
LFSRIPPKAAPGVDCDHPRHPSQLPIHLDRLLIHAHGGFSFLLTSLHARPTRAESEGVSRAPLGAAQRAKPLDTTEHRANLDLASEAH